MDGAELAVMPGTLAKWYSEEMGGVVRLIGKPAAVIYEAAMHELCIDPRHVLAVGDSMEHDITGWVAQGGVWVGGGGRGQGLGQGEVHGLKVMGCFGRMHALPCEQH
jgi:hypothetical protein